MNSNLIYLVQTDTTVGFLSQDAKKINRLKKRDENQKLLKTIISFSQIEERVPSKFKNYVRRAKNTTFIIKENSYRKARGKSHKRFIEKFKFMYSSSANETGKNFDEKVATELSDVIVYRKENFSENRPSKIVKLYKDKVKVIRK